MKLITPLFTQVSAITLLLLSSAAFANELQEGESLYKTHCAACHGATGGMDMSKRIAPPIIGVRKHYIDVHPEKQAFVAAVSSWLEKQDESKSLMRGAIQRFKIMPPITIPKGDAVKIATYIYAGKIEKPAGFDEHVAMMHGNKMHGGNMMKHQGAGMTHQGMGMKHQGMGMKHQGMGMKHQGMGMKHQGMGMPANRQGMAGNRQQQRKHDGRQGIMKGMKNMRSMQVQMMMGQLNLSPQQKQKMQPLIQNKIKIMMPLKKRMLQLNQQVQDLDTTSPDYKTSIFSLADEKGRLVHRMVIEKGEMRMKIESVLTPEQRKKFAKLRAQKRAMKQGMKNSQ